MNSATGVSIRAKRHERKRTITGTHQKINEMAYYQLRRHIKRSAFFPNAKEINHFEGMRGPDGLKFKSPGIDEPSHFIDPENDDGAVREMIDNHSYNLKEALKKGDRIRAAFEAAWLSHAIVDGLTPAHHFPLPEIQQKLMKQSDFFTIFGRPVKGVMVGRNMLETAKNNWQYWGKDGFMTTHLAFEYGVALTVSVSKKSTLQPKLKISDFEDVDVQNVFTDALNKIYSLSMYDLFQKDGYTQEFISETRHILIPEIIKAVTLAWYAALKK